MTIKSIIAEFEYKGISFDIGDKIIVDSNDGKLIHFYTSIHLEDEVKVIVHEFEFDEESEKYFYSEDFVKIQFSN